LSRQSYRSSHNRTPALPALRAPHVDTAPVSASAHSNRSQTSFNSRSGRVTTGTMDGDRSRSRRERTFVGSACAVCEEPLEHTLRGERVLQFSCTHVSHEACFYEYIKEFESQYCPTCNAPLGLDTSRGGNVLDLGKLTQYSTSPVQLPNNPLVAEKLSNIVRSQSVSDGATLRSGLTTPTPWDNRSQPTAAHDGHRSIHQDSLYNNRRDSHTTSNSQRERIERLTTGSSRQHHARQDSGATGVASSGEYTDGQHHSTGRRHDYDLQAMESDLSPRATHIKNPIPAPIVTVRSEFPTLNRSRQQQPLTCLVTVEVPDGHWRPDMEDLRFTPLNSQLPAEDIYNPIRSPTMPPSRPPPPEPRENMDEIAEELRLRVDNWHGLEFSR
jgi:hypothetical protein